MSVFVVGYQTIKVGPDEPLPPEPIEVGYSATPEWRMTIEEANMERGLLERMGVHVAHHYCQFAVEKTPDGDFAIVCTTHPPSLRLQQTAR